MMPDFATLSVLGVTQAQKADLGMVCAQQLQK